MDISTITYNNQFQLSNGSTQSASAGTQSASAGTQSALAGTQSASATTVQRIERHESFESILNRVPSVTSISTPKKDIDDLDESDSEYIYADEFSKTDSQSSDSETDVHIQDKFSQQIEYFANGEKKRSLSEVYDGGETDMFEQMAERTGPYAPSLKKQSVQDLRAQMERKYAAEVLSIRYKIILNQNLSYEEKLVVKDHYHSAKYGQFSDVGIFRTAEEFEQYKAKY